MKNVSAARKHYNSSETILHVTGL